MLKLQIQYFGHLMRRSDSLEKTLMGKTEMVGWHHQFTWTWANSWRWWGTWRPGMLQSMGSQRVGHDLVTEQQEQQWTRGWSSASHLPLGKGPKWRTLVQLPGTWDLPREEGGPKRQREATEVCWGPAGAPWRETGRRSLRVTNTPPGKSDPPAFQPRSREAVRRPPVRSKASD